MGNFLLIQLRINLGFRLLKAGSRKTEDRSTFKNDLTSIFEAISNKINCN
jgi:hypothetical protein